MEPIVSPLFVYGLNVVDDIRALMFAVGVVVAAICVFCIMNYFKCYYDWEFPWEFLDEDDIVNQKKARKKIAIFSVVALIIFIVAAFVPSKNTLIGMKIAEYVTEENVDYTVEQLRGAVDYIVDKIDEIKD